MGPFFGCDLKFIENAKNYILLRRVQGIQQCRLALLHFGEGSLINLFSTGRQMEFKHALV